MSNIENKKTIYQLVLLNIDEEIVVEDLESRENLNALFNALEGDELVESVIHNVHRYIFALFDWTTDTDFDNICRDDAEMLQDTVCEELTEVIARFITDEHREAIVRYHARGLSTTEAIATLIVEDSIMNRLAQPDALGEQTLKDLLIPRLAYLKPGSTRWPEKKYGAVWRKERQQYIEEINNTPFSTPAERIALLAKHAERVNHALNNKEHSLNDLQSLTQTLTKTLESLEKLSPADQQTSANLPTPQLTSILERFTIALEAFQQIASTGDANAIVEVVERLTLALQPPLQQIAITSKTEESNNETSVSTSSTKAD
ncbi:hypothetical protein F4141_13385 [Candidatus Poribacteria bacterium]|nr:hypothetical protein [Candidatus Poribacteria bacterium]MYH81677.1 hypothetical protein [Candidatus Poribacteria bacterium]